MERFIERSFSALANMSSSSLPAPFTQYPMSSARSITRPGRGPALALGSAVLFGASTPLAKLLLGQVSPWLLAGLLYLGAGIGLAAYRVLARGRRAREASVPRSQYGILLAVVLTGGMLAPVLLMRGLAATPASTAALLLNLEGVFTLSLAWVVFHENVGLRIGLGAASILLGAALLSAQSGATLTWGALAIAGACLAWALDNNLTRKLSSADPVQVALIKDLAAGCANIVLAYTAGAAIPPLSTSLLAGAVGLAGYGVSLVLYVLALRHVGAARTGAYFSLAPFVGSALAVLLLRDPLNWQLLAAAALMGIGLWLHLTERHDHLHVHDPVVHEHAHVHDKHHQHAHDEHAPPGQSHTHVHAHAGLTHSHAHYPDIHHRHRHGRRRSIDAG